MGKKIPPRTGGGEHDPFVHRPFPGLPDQIKRKHLHNITTACPRRQVAFVVCPRQFVFFGPAANPRSAKPLRTPRERRRDGVGTGLRSGDLLVYHFLCNDNTDSDMARQRGRRSVDRAGAVGRRSKRRTVGIIFACRIASLGMVETNTSSLYCAETYPRSQDD